MAVPKRFKKVARVQKKNYFEKRFLFQKKRFFCLHCFRKHLSHFCL